MTKLGRHAHFQLAGGEPGSKRQSFRITLLCSIKTREIGGRGIIVESSVGLISKMASFISHDQIFVEYEQTVYLDSRRSKYVRM